MSCRIAWLGLAALMAWGIMPSAGQVDSKNIAAGQGKSQDAKCVKIQGALLLHVKDGFKALKVGDSIPPQTLIVGLPEAELVAADGRVGIKLLLHQGDSLPVTEAAIMLNETAKNQADVTIDRGIVEFTNLGTGDTTLHLRSAKQVWELTLKDSGSAVLVARFGRHEPGTKQFQGARPKGLVDEPLVHFGVLVVKGRAIVNNGSQTYALNAPPGPALMVWDSSAGYEVKHLEGLPDEVRKLDLAELKNYKEVCDVTAKLAAGDFGKGLDEMVKSDSPIKRRVAVACMGATDELPRLWDALENAKHRDVREQAVVTIRNWIGRHHGQITKLYDHISTAKKYTPAQARTVLMLLKGFDESDRKEPLTYQLLIGALEAAALPIRELAYWNLERLAPAGQTIAYDAGADEAARRQAVTQWRQLIPEGQLPPPPKKDKK